MYSVEDLELSILAAFYCVRKARDRLPDQFTRGDVCAITGLPLSANDLKPIYRAESGDGLALSWTPVPSDMAASMIRYQTNPGVSDSEVEWKTLNLKPKDQWTTEEMDTHRELTFRIKLAAHQLASRGFMNLRPDDFEEGPQAFGEDGMTARIQITPLGLEEAKRRVKGTKYEGMYRGWEDALPASEFAKTPEWLRNQSADRHSLNQ